MGLREESRISFRIMIEDGYCPEEPLYFNNSRTMKGGVREVNKAAVLDFYLCFFKFTSDNNKKWAYGLEYLRQFISNNSKFHPDNIKPNESINEEILIGDATFSRAKRKLCKNSKP